LWRQPRLYREIARRAHPDLAKGEYQKTLYERLMKDANGAYSRGDEAQLQDLLGQWKRLSVVCTDSTESE